LEAATAVEKERSAREGGWEQLRRGLAIDKPEEEEVLKRKRNNKLGGNQMKSNTIFEKEVVNSSIAEGRTATLRNLGKSMEEQLVKHNWFRGRNSWMSEQQHGLSVPPRWPLLLHHVLHPTQQDSSGREETRN
jgi:hypothetical protein